MAKFCDTLLVRKGACPADCSICVDACAARNGSDNLGAVIKIINEEGKEQHSVATCYQCGEPQCMDVCPSDAITKDEVSGIVRVDADLCTGCEACVDGCSYGMMFFNDDKQIATKCDMCDGQPACVEACPYGVITLLKSSSVNDTLKGRKDIVPSGNPLCGGCGADLALRLYARILGDNADKMVMQTCMGCCHLTVQSMMTATVSSLLPSVPALMTGMSRYWRKKGMDHILTGYIGDGTTADIGFQALSAAAERGEKFIFACYDNEGYENTGIQKSSTTPYGAWTTTTQVGKEGQGKGTPAKNVALLMAMHRIPYAATLNIAYLDDFIMKVEKAKEAVKHGMVYLHMFTSCPTAWRSEVDTAIDLGRTAVESNYYPLWEAIDGKLKLTYKPKSKRPITDFTKMQGRFKHLDAEHLKIFQKWVDDNYAIVAALDAAKY
ncbi:MAG: phenylglyoxylate dehydrogenase [Chloroflexi bacterium]|nr:phenylglyoxylate dehydrogenase [Chloroflexota bacterium]MBT7080668.1 phenylglyoxylate dehydrogenase [Chloroflexota bacterium]MBT7289925.1 phenylglyoxylate dehydrogenase [Chloroflexota bacterium]